MAVRATRVGRGVLVVAAALLTGACGAGTAAPGTPAGPGGPGDRNGSSGPVQRTERPGTAGSLRGAQFYVDPATQVARQVRSLREEGRQDEAAALQPLAAQPTGVWVLDRQHVRDRVLPVLTGAAAAGRLPLLVLYGIPQRDCGQDLRDPATADGYRDLVGALADALGNAEAVVVLEPDAVAHLVGGCLDARRREERVVLLREAVTRLTQRPGVRLYVDAGHAGWIQDLDALAATLREVGVTRAAGFALNVANFRTVEESRRYGDRLSERLDDLPYLVDTSRNGAGPAPASDPLGWCNPPGRRVGPPPTTRTGLPRVDAFAWVKVPGESDGTCRPGEPPAGTLWTSYALDLLERP